MSICISICMSICMSICISICMSICIDDLHFDLHVDLHFDLPPPCSGDTAAGHRRDTSEKISTSPPCSGAPVCRRRIIWSGRGPATGEFPLARPRSFASPARTARTKPKSISRLGGLRFTLGPTPQPPIYIYIYMYVSHRGPQTVVLLP